MLLSMVAYAIRHVLWCVCVCVVFVLLKAWWLPQSDFRSFLY